MEYVLTEPGRQKIADYILQCAAKRKEILDAGIDTADATRLPTEDDILSDLNYGTGTDEDGDYYNCWGVTDGYNSDYPLGLEAGKDFIEKETMLRIAEIETTLANEEYENEVEECCLEIELQFLQGSKNAYNEPYAFIGTDNVSFDVIYEEENDRYSATLYDKDGNPQMPYLNDKDVHKLVEQILENGEKDDGKD